MITLLTVIIFIALGSCTSDLDQAPPKSESESMTPQEVTELYDTYCSLYKSALNGASRSASDVVDPVELAKKLRPMTVEELEAYRDSILAAHPEYPTKAMDSNIAPQ